MQSDNSTTSTTTVSKSNSSNTTATTASNTTITSESSLTTAFPTQPPDQLMSYVHNYLLNWLHKVTTTTTTTPSRTTTRPGGGGGGYNRPPHVPGSETIYANGVDGDSQDVRRGGGLVGRDEYLQYVRRKNEGRYMNNYNQYANSFWSK